MVLNRGFCKKSPPGIQDPHRVGFGPSEVHRLFKRQMVMQQQQQQQDTKHISFVFFGGFVENTCFFCHLSCHLGPLCCWIFIGFYDLHLHLEAQLVVKHQGAKRTGYLQTSPTCLWNGSVGVPQHQGMIVTDGWFGWNHGGFRGLVLWKKQMLR